MKFEWDLNKAESNLKKHGISFDEAKSIFYDLLSVTVSDPIANEEKGVRSLLLHSHFYFKARKGIKGTQHLIIASFPHSLC